MWPQEAYHPRRSITSSLVPGVEGYHMSCRGGGGGIPVMSGEGYPYPVRGYSSPVQLGTPVLSCLGYPPAGPGDRTRGTPSPRKGPGTRGWGTAPPEDTHLWKLRTRAVYILPVNNPTWQKYNICLHWVLKINSIALLQFSDKRWN